MLFGSDLLRFRSLRIVGNAQATEGQLRHLADLPVGGPLLLVDLDEAVAGALRHPWVAEAHARRVFPDTVVLQVREREVRALLLLDQLYLLDASGTPFRKASAEHLDHPVITGLPPGIVESAPPLARRIIRDALAVLDAVPGRGGLQEVDVSEVRFDAESGYTLVLQAGGEVLLGFQDPAAFSRLDSLAARGVDLSHPLRVDLGSPSLAVVSPL